MLYNALVPAAGICRKLLKPVAPTSFIYRVSSYFLSRGSEGFSPKARQGFHFIKIKSNCLLNDSWQSLMEKGQKPIQDIHIVETDTEKNYDLRNYAAKGKKGQL